jgi:hypothetical protein
MTYRDGHEAQRSRIAELESELAEAERTISALRRLPGDRLRERMFGAPLRFERTATLPLEIDDEGCRAVSTLLQSRIAMSTSATPTGIAGAGFSLTREGRTTVIRLSADWKRRTLTLAALLACCLVIGMGSWCPWCHAS